MSGVWPRDEAFASAEPRASSAVDRGQRACARRSHQRCFASGERQVRIGAGLEQTSDERIADGRETALVFPIVRN
jgi:hypothetical protein